MSDYTGSGSSDPGDDLPRPIADAGTAGAAPPRPGLISSASAPAGGRVSEVWAESTSQATAPPSSSQETAVATPNIELSASECRVLGAMIEKSYLTPDVYPMTTNAMVSACNQKTNRDPVVNYSAVDIDTTLMDLRQRNLVRRVHSPGSRSTKHRQTVDEVLALDEQQLALISVLLLRGPQTVGELRLRTERHDVGFDDLGAVDRCLESMASRVHPLVQQLARQPGHKENRWQHLLAEADATAHQDTAEAHPSPGLAAQPITHPVTHPVTQSITQPIAQASATETDVTELTDRVDELETQVATLQRQLASLADKLGEPLE